MYAKKILTFLAISCFFMGAVKAQIFVCDNYMRYEKIIAPNSFQSLTHYIKKYADLYAKIQDEKATVNDKIICWDSLLHAVQVDTDTMGKELYLAYLEFAQIAFQHQLQQSTWRERMEREYAILEKLAAEKRPMWAMQWWKNTIMALNMAYRQSGDKTLHAQAWLQREQLEGVHKNMQAYLESFMDFENLKLETIPIIWELKAHSHTVLIDELKLYKKAPLKIQNIIVPMIFNPTYKDVIYFTKVQNEAYLQSCNEFLKYNIAENTAEKIYSIFQKTLQYHQAQNDTLFLLLNDFNRLDFFYRYTDLPNKKQILKQTIAEMSVKYLNTKWLPYVQYFKLYAHATFRWIEDAEEYNMLRKEWEIWSAKPPKYLKVDKTLLQEAFNRKVFRNTNKRVQGQK